MARNRQRAKQRQAQRREERVAARDALGRDVAADAPPVRDALGRELDELDELAGPISAATGAPPENVGRSDTVAESPPPPPVVDGRLEGDELDEEDAVDSDELEAAETEADALSDRPARGPRGRRGEASKTGQPVRGTGIARVGAFLTACWAELQRVQWPDRRALTQLTGIVLFFVILAGAYLGALDAIFSKLIQAIL
ncbi:MAG: preprotein translocase subunit SecE [Actinobacteria bacterium]|nr:preprotein translocase subunit SecE [Actinomycetota bacterium]